MRFLMSSISSYSTCNFRKVGLFMGLAGKNTFFVIHCLLKSTQVVCSVLKANFYKWWEHIARKRKHAKNHLHLYSTYFMHRDNVKHQDFTLTLHQIVFSSVNIAWERDAYSVDRMFSLYYVDL